METAVSVRCTHVSFLAHIVVVFSSIVRVFGPFAPNHQGASDAKNLVSGLAGCAVHGRASSSSLLLLLITLLFSLPFVCS